MDEIGCDFEFTNNLSKYGKTENRYVEVYQTNGNPERRYVVKKEYPHNKNESTKEYDFYKKYSPKIKHDGLDKNINIPLKILHCDNDSVMFVFNYIENDYNKKYIDKITYKQWIDYTTQLCLFMYYLNHLLHVFHNDLRNKYGLWNIMIKQNETPYTITVDDFKYTIRENYIVIIDFGEQRKNMEHKSKWFYDNKWKPKKHYKYQTEVFMVFYYSYFLFFGIADQWGEKYDDIYDRFVNEFERKNKVHDVRNFDKYIVQSLMDLPKN